MNTKFRMFLIIVSAFALAQGIMGAIGISGPLPQNSYFGSSWYFDYTENIIHTVTGVIGIAVGLYGTAYLQRLTGYALGGGAFFLGVLSAVGPVTEGATILGAHLQNPGDTILHLVAGGLTLVLVVKASMSAGKGNRKHA